MNIKRENLVAIWETINRLKREKTSVKFNYSILRNKKLIEPEIKTLEEAQTQSTPDGYLEYDKERISICERLADKDENGKAIQINNNYIIPDDKQEDFKKALDELKEKHKEAVEAMEKRQDEFMELLKEEVNIEFHIIPLSIIPDSISGTDIELLFDFIDGDK